MESKRNNRDKASYAKVCDLVLMSIMDIVAILLAVKLIMMSILPAFYLIGFAIIILLLNVASVFAGKKLQPAIAMSAIHIIMIFTILYGFFAVLKLEKTLDAVSTDSRLETIEMSVIVRSDDNAEELTDIDGYTVGFVNGADGVSDICNKLSDENLDVTYKEYENVLFLVDALLEKKIDAVIMNRTYIEVIGDQDGYEDFINQVKVIYTLEVEVEVPVEAVTETEAEVEVPADYELVSGKDTMVIYVSGIDVWGGVHVKSRSDVNILAIVNTKTGHVQLINTPRDYYITLPEFGATDKLTHAGIYGVECSESALEALYGVKIDYFVRMNFSGFEQLINTLGGVDVWSANDFTVDPIKHYTEGYNHVNGLEALAFARERHAFANGDVQRGLNQMEMIKAVVAKMSSFTMIANYSDVFDSVADCIQTDMPTEVIYDLVKYQLAHNVEWKIDPYTVTGSGSHETTYSMPSTTTYVMIPDQEQVDAAKTLIEETLLEE